MIFHKKVERELTQNEMNKYLKRPVAKEEFVAEGAHEATIESARAIFQSNPFTTSGISEELQLELKVEDGGKEVYLKHNVNLAWDESGDLCNMLLNLEELPEEGEVLNIEDLIGMDVKILVTNCECEGKTYSEVIDIEKKYRQG